MVEKAATLKSRVLAIICRLKFPFGFGMSAQDYA